MTSPGGRRGAASAAYAYVRGALWPIPVIGVVLAISLGFALPAVDEALSAGVSVHPLAFGFGGGPSAARDLLAAIAGSLISVTGVTFTLTVVALQLGSSQYSPRLLQTFVTDRMVQLTLAQLMATFVYALTVLRTVRTESATEGDDAFVPQLSITVAYALTLGSVLALVLFLGHLAGSLRVETMLRDVHDEATSTVAQVLDRDDAADSSAAELPAAQGTPLCASSSGFVVDVDGRRILETATQCGAVVLLAVRPGDSVVTGTPVAHAWPDRPGGVVDVESLERSIGKAIRLSFERSPDRDIAYSLRKVVDIAVRALSPGINDPTTAVHALSHASAILGTLLGHSLRPTRLADDDGTLRVVLPQWTAADLLQLAVEEPLEFASGQPAVLRRMAVVLQEVAWVAPDGLLDDLLRSRLGQLVGLAEETTRIPEEERRFWERRLTHALAGEWVAERPTPAPGVSPR